MQSQTKSQSSISQLLPLLMQTGVGIVILLIIWLVVSSLPMLGEISFPLDFTLTELLGAVLLTIIVVILCSFGSRMELRMRYLMASFPQAGTMIKQFVYLIVVLIVYFAYQPLAVPYMADLDWIYHLLFLIIFLAYLGILGFSIYNNMEEFTALITASKGAPGAPSSAVSVICGKCGEKNIDGAQFCSFCGETLPQPQKCGCGHILKTGAKFCFSCGAKAGDEVNQTAAEGATAAAPLSINRCAACQVELKPGAKFCSKCGSAQA